MTEKNTCARPSAGWLIWPGREPVPMCSFHKEAPLNLARMMGWMATFNVGEAGPCESYDPHPEDEEVEVPSE